MIDVTSLVEANISQFHKMPTGNVDLGSVEIITPGGLYLALENTECVTGSDKIRRLHHDTSIAKALNRIYGLNENLPNGLIASQDAFNSRVFEKLVAKQIFINKSGFTLDQNAITVRHFNLKTQIIQNNAITLISPIIITPAQCNILSRILASYASLAGVNIIAGTSGFNPIELVFCDVAEVSDYNDLPSHLEVRDYNYPEEVKVPYDVPLASRNLVRKI